MIEEFEANPDEIKRCFTNIRINLCQATKDNKRIRELCIEKGVDTSVEYERLRLRIPELPEDPRPNNTTWFNYLHPMLTERISGADFVNSIPHDLLVGHEYDKWRGIQSVANISKLPSVQHIIDGYLGLDNTNFNTLRDKFGIKVTGRGR